VAGVTFNEMASEGVAIWVWHGGQRNWRRRRSIGLSEIKRQAKPGGGQSENKRRRKPGRKNRSGGGVKSDSSKLNGEISNQQNGGKNGRDVGGERKWR
jgi:hypothetical protein